MAECPVDVHFLYLPWDLERFELWIWLILFLAHSHSSISTDRKKGYSLVCFSKKERKVVEYTGGLHTIHYSIPSVPHHISSWLVTDFSPFTTTVVTSFFYIYFCIPLYQLSCIGGTAGLRDRGAVWSWCLVLVDCLGHFLLLPTQTDGDGFGLMKCMSWRMF